MTDYRVTEVTDVFDVESEEEAIEVAVGSKRGSMEVVSQDAELLSPWKHPLYDDWRYLVANGDTLRGFTDWLKNERGEDQEV